MKLWPDVLTLLNKWPSDAETVIKKGAAVTPWFSAAEFSRLWKWAAPRLAALVKEGPKILYE
jgi:hypothetical protein